MAEIDFNNLDKMAAEEDSAEYKAFTEKFKPKKTTDDCFTPPEVYAAVLSWVREEWSIDDAVPIVRPFYPGGDYESYDYPDGCVVVDNPPFSLSAKIRRFYNAHGIRFFLFAPTLTLCSAYDGVTNYIVAGADVVYENGASVNTSFATNLPGPRLRVCGPLATRIKVANAVANAKPQLPVYEYPANVTSAARLQKLARGTVDLKIAAHELQPVSKLKAQGKKAIFGKGFLLSDQAAERLREAERLQIFELSEDEQAIVDVLTAMGD